MTQKAQTVRPFPRSAIGFQPEYLDFQKGIHVGNLNDNQRITRILKLALEARYQEAFVTERYGRGVYWQWIGFLPRSNRSAKPISSKVSFGCSKFFLTVDTAERVFRCGFSVERGMIQAPHDFPKIQLKPDWDWHRLMKQCAAGTKLDDELRRLLKREGFVAEVGNFETNTVFNAKNFKSARQIRDAAKKSPKKNEWAGFQLYYPMPEREVRTSTGYELVKAICGVFDEVTPAMNCCMQVPLESVTVARLK